MASKTRMLEQMKCLDVAGIEAALTESPGLLAFRDARGRNWLHLCAGVDVRKKRLEPAAAVRIAQLLLDRGIDIDAPAFTENEGTFKATPVWFSVARGRNVALTEFLLREGADPNYTLWAAAFDNNTRAIDLLVAHGADIDPVTEDETPFLGAVKWSRFIGARRLLELGANPDFQDSKRMTALHYMLKKGTDIEHVRMVLDYGARLDIENADGRTAREILSRKRDPAFRELAAQRDGG